MDAARYSGEEKADERSFTQVGLETLDESVFVRGQYSFWP
jgi:hypothetical protein